MTPTHQIVEIEATDSPPTSSPAVVDGSSPGQEPSTSITHGDWQVGVDMAPGRWQADPYPSSIVGGSSDLRVG
jgi:hypothetical protein